MFLVSMDNTIHCITKSVNNNLTTGTKIKMKNGKKRDKFSYFLFWFGLGYSMMHCVFLL